MKEINLKERAINFNSAKKIHVVVEESIFSNDAPTVKGIPAIKNDSTNKWMQVGNQPCVYKILDLQPTDAY